MARPPRLTPDQLCERVTKLLQKRVQEIRDDEDDPGGCASIDDMEIALEALDNTHGTGALPEQAQYVFVFQDGDAYREIRRATHTLRGKPVDLWTAYRSATHRASVRHPGSIYTRAVLYLETLELDIHPLRH